MGMRAKNGDAKKAEVEVKANAKACLDRVLAQPRLDLYRDRADLALNLNLNRGQHLDRAQDLPLNEGPKRKAQKKGQVEGAKAKAIQDRAHEQHRRVVHVDLPNPDLAQDQDHAIRADLALVQDQQQSLQ